MVPESVITRRRDDQCLALYALLDVKSGPQRYTVRGFRYVADLLGWQVRTVSVHARHLADAGLIDLTESKGKAAATMAVAHNPGRHMVRDDVNLPPRPLRARKESGWTTYADDGGEAAGDVARPAHLRRDASGAPQRDASDASRPRSASRSELGMAAPRGAPVPSSSVPPPASFDGFARERIVADLVRDGCSPAAAEAGAEVALAEAPFEDPTPESWQVACARAREVARAEPEEPEPSVAVVPQIPEPASPSPVDSTTAAATATATALVLQAFPGTVVLDEDAA